MKRNFQLVLILSVIAACDVGPPLINQFVDGEPAPITQAWFDSEFLNGHPNAAEHALIDVNSQQLLNDIERIRITLLNGEIITAIRQTSEASDGSIRWKGAVEGVTDSHVKILATDNPYLIGHVVIGERVELFAHSVPGADSIMYRMNMPDRSYSAQADILPDADPAEIAGVAWRGLVEGLPASAYRIVSFDKEAWRRMSEELEESGTTTMRFFDNTPHRIVRVAMARKEPAKYNPIEYIWRIEGAEYSLVVLHVYGDELRGYVQSQETGNVRVTKLDDSGHYVIWTMHPETSAPVD